MLQGEGWEHGLAARFAENLGANRPSRDEAISIFSSGALAGLALEAAVHSARVLHTRHEQLKAGHRLGTLGLRWWLAALWSPLRFRGPYHGARGTLAAGTLWSGIFGSLYVPTRAAADASFPPTQPWWGPLLGASAGSLASSCVRVPLEVVKGRMQQREFFCSLQAFELILRREGFSALYRGWRRSVLRNLIFDAPLFVLYDAGKQGAAALKSHKQQQQQPERPEAAVLYQQHEQQQRQLSAAGDRVPEAATPAGGLQECSSGGDAEPPPLSPELALWDIALVGGVAGAAAGLLAGVATDVGAALAGRVPEGGGGCIMVPPCSGGHGGQPSQRSLPGASPASGGGGCVTLCAAGGAGGAGAGATSSSTSRCGMGHGSRQALLGGKGYGGTSCADGSPWVDPGSQHNAGMAGGSSCTSSSGVGGSTSTSSCRSSTWAGKTVHRVRAGMRAVSAQGLRTRMAWAALEGAVFFTALEAAIPACDWVFLLPGGGGQNGERREAGMGMGTDGVRHAAAVGSAMPWDHVHW